MRRINRITACLLLLAVAVAGQSNAKFTTSRDGMISTGSTYATEAGARMLAAGGNAVDAAAAACLVLMVTDPSNTSLGGRAQILIRLKDGRVVPIDGATRSPADIPPLKDKADDRGGYKITPVPGAVAALEEMVKRYGKLRFSRVMQPAIDLAAKGFVVPPRLAASWERTRDVIARDEGARQNFLKSDGSAYKAGDLFVQPRLAATLTAIARRGTWEFYRGSIARAMAEDIERKGGFVRLADLAAYRPESGNSIHTTYRGYDVISAGGRAWGNTLAELLNILENFTIARDPANRYELEVLARTIAQAMEDRPQQIGTLQPKTNGFSLEEISTKEFARKRADKIKAKLVEGAASAADQSPSPDESHDTSHLSVMDKEGNAVSLTTSIGPAFGARVVTPELGFFYAHSYLMRSTAAPNTRDLTEMTPTIVFRDKVAVMVVGGAGSERIPPAVLQVISNVLDRGLSLEEAMLRPRIFCIGDTLRMQHGFSEDLMSAMRLRGFKIEMVADNAARHNGIVHAIRYDPATRTYFGGADPGDSGSSRGPLK